MTQETTLDQKITERENYRIEEFCSRYAISRRSLYREIEADRLHAFKRGRRTLIAHIDAEAWHANDRKNRVRPESSIAEAE